MKIPSVGLNDDENKNKKSVEQKNIEFLEDISSSFNFEAEDQDAYICVLFDLLLYKYPSLAKGVFELMVRLFTRKRTLLENLMGIQMLENPRSIWILGKVKKYSTELKKLIEDAEHWLNKTNKQSKNIKFRVTQIFRFFTQICQEGGVIDEDEGDIDAAPQTISHRDVGGLSRPPTARIEEEKAPHQDGTHGCSVSGKIDKQDFILFEKRNLP